jgi:hypothetical protein
MSRADLQDFREESLDAERTANLAASEDSARAWERDHPWSVDDFLDFLASFQEIFGPFPAREDLTAGEQFRL